MKKAIEFIENSDADFIREINDGKITRSELKIISENKGYSRTTGERAHRLIHAHDNIDAFIAFYIDGVSHSMEAAESPEVEGNVADITVKYPHGRPVRGVENLLDDHGMDPDEWEIDSITVNEWPTTMGNKNGDVVYVNNYQAKARLMREERKPKYERVQPVNIDVPDPPDVQPLEKSRPDGWETALVLMDRQTGHRRGQQSWQYQTIHDREAIDLAVQVAALCKPEVLVDVGDLMDFAGVSDYVGTPDLRRSLQPALCECAYDNTRFLSAAEPDEFHIIQGNHDKRIDDALIEDAQELYQLRDVEAQAEEKPPAMSVPNLLKFDEMGINWHEGYPDNELLLNDGVAIKHGETAKSDSGGTVRNILKYDATDYSHIFGHIHRHEIAWQTVWKGRQRRELCAASGGTLCRVDGGVPGTKDRQNWQQGLIEINYDPNGWEHTVRPIRIWPNDHGESHSVCWYKGKKLVADPPSAEKLSETTGFDFT